MSVAIKPGVRLVGVSVAMAVAAQVVDGALAPYQPNIPTVITSGIDGVHEPDSSHYRGEALDFRTHTIMEGQPQASRLPVLRQLRDKIQGMLGPDFQVILHEGPTPEDPKAVTEHLHVQHRPSTALVSL